MGAAGKNRLQFEKSPYLRQHADNPVDWMPWGDEAFEAAAAQDKPLLISIGYSTCHWCHVMERESFSDPAVAELMNKHFVCVKVDREERPDVDRIYMSAVQAMTGSGGWPLNCFVTPQGKPFYGGTYFPPRGAFNRPSWSDLLKGLAEAWNNTEKRSQIEMSSDNLVDAVRQINSLPEKVEGPLDPGLLSMAAESLMDSYDRQEGGFSPAPKFPMPAQYPLLFRAWRDARETRPEWAEALKEAALSSLRKMAQGGIFDQVGGGFARYATDPRWNLPHFEKMLYDNAQLALVYLEAWQVSGDDFYLKIARRTLDYLLRDMRDPAGGFYSAEDADSKVSAGGDEKAEGAFYVWTESQIDQALGTDAGWFKTLFGVAADGNVKDDPHQEFAGKNVLYRAMRPEDAGKDEAAVDRALETLRQARDKRPRPHRDEKIICAWNAMAIQALAKAYTLTGQEEYLQAAKDAEKFIQKSMTAEGKLFRSFGEGECHVLAHADDYTQWTAAALALHEATSETVWLQLAETLADKSQALFFDDADGSYYMTQKDSDPRLLMRLKETQDNVEPSAASVAAMNNLRLWLLAGREDLREAAEKTLTAFAPGMREHPRGFCSMLAAARLFVEAPRHALVVGKADQVETKTMLQALRRVWSPYAVVLQVTPGQDTPAGMDGEMAMLDEKATAYICADFACRLPTTDPKEAVSNLVSA